MIIEKFKIEESKIKQYVENTLKLKYVFFDSIKGYNQFKKSVTIYKNELDYHENLVLFIKLNKNVKYLMINKLEFTEPTPPKHNPYVSIQVSELLNPNDLDYNHIPSKLEITEEMIDEEIKRSQERWANKNFTPEEKSYFVTMGEAIGKLLDYKNKKYGNSALEPLNIFGNKSKVGTRIDEKLARIKNSDVLLLNDEIDLIGYLLLDLKDKNIKPDDLERFKD